VGKVAQICGVSNRTVLNWINAGKIKAHALPSGHFRIHVDEVRAFMSAHDMAAPARLTEADAIQQSLCWNRADLTGDHRCAECKVFHTQAWHCFVLRSADGDASVGCDEVCAECAYYREVVRPLADALELEGQPCAVSRGGVILAANGALQTLLRRSAADVVGESWSALAAGDDLALLFARDAGSADSSPLGSCEGALVLRGGDQLEVTFVVAPFPRVWGAVQVRLAPR
jgi:excisionase family DNA binding protein